ncbi:MAG: single-stranded-DNA-specific exonuclease RecJ [Planctomycetota bacterium]
MPAPSHAAAFVRKTRWDIVGREGDDRPLLDRVLAARGLSEPEAASAFLDATLLDLHDPMLLPGVAEAVDATLRAVADGRPIVIYGDYDVDGITATAVLYRMLTHLEPAADIRAYVPHRLDEGYGLNARALEELAADGAGLVISVDCGVTAIEQAAVARRLGLELVITDHHNPDADGQLPDAAAVVHPGLPGSAYPFDGLCGAGVAYKLAWALAVRHADRPDGKAAAASRAVLLDLLAFAALGTIADMVPLQDENRVIARYGLGRVKHSPFEGLSALVDASGLAGEKIDADDVGFRLGPRLNACGRMGHAADAVELFTTATGDRARQIAAQLHEQNTQRQRTERRITEQAAAMAAEAGFLDDSRSAIVLAHDEWHPGVVGIVCSRLVERFARPTVLLCREAGVLKGSGRSITGFNLHAALAECRGCLRTFGGHDAAAGLSLTEDNLAAFTEQFLAAAGQRLGPDDLVHRIRIDTRAAPEELTTQAVTMLGRLKPFGRGNPRVRVLVRSAALARPPETFGSHAKHLAIALESPGGPPLRCIAWNQGGRRDELRRGQRIDAVLTPQISSYSGRVEPVLDDWSAVAADDYSSSTGKLATPPVG